MILEKGLSHLATEGGDVCTLGKNLGFKHTLDKLDLVRHNFESQELSNLQILLLPMSQFPGRLGWPSRCEHSVTLYSCIIVFFTTTNVVLHNFFFLSYFNFIATYKLRCETKRNSLGGGDENKKYTIYLAS